MGLLYPRHCGRESGKTTSVQAYADCLMSKQRELSKMILVIEAENRMNVILEEELSRYYHQDVKIRNDRLGLSLD